MMLKRVLKDAALKLWVGATMAAKTTRTGGQEYDIEMRKEGFQLR
jgi:hypothetical protein